MLKKIVFGGLLAAVAVGVAPSASAAPQATRCTNGFEVVCFVVCFSPHPKLDRCA